jgi:isoleucyl-tRNA synthetase
MSVDYKDTLRLPRTDFPMKAGLPQKEPLLLERWENIGLEARLREQGTSREKFILHDGPPYANGHLHIGHALNKILKDVINRSQQMMGKDAHYVPGWDCHGLPIEANDGQGCPLRAGLGLPRPADRMENRREVPRRRQGQGRGADRRIPPGMP